MKNLLSQITRNLKIKLTYLNLKLALTDSGAYNLAALKKIRTNLKLYMEIKKSCVKG